MYNRLEPELKEKVKPYKDAAKAALDDLEETVAAGGDVDLTAVLHAFNEALEAFNEALDTT